MSCFSAVPGDLDRRWKWNMSVSWREIRPTMRCSQCEAHAADTGVRWLSGEDGSQAHRYRRLHRFADALLGGPILYVRPLHGIAGYLTRAVSIRLRLATRIQASDSPSTGIRSSPSPFTDDTVMLATSFSSLIRHASWDRSKNLPGPQ